MSRRPRSLTVALAALFAAALALPGVAQAQQPNNDLVPFKVVIKAKEDPAASFLVPFDPPLYVFKNVGTGDGNPTGPFTFMEFGTDQQGADGKSLVAHIRGIFTFPNGDAFFGQWSGLTNRDPAEAGFVITGGRGRYKGATGSGMISATAGPNPGEFICIFEGLISPPKPAQ